MAMEQIICLFLIICGSHQPFFQLNFAHFDLRNKEKVEEGNSEKRSLQFHLQYTFIAFSSCQMLPFHVTYVRDGRPKKDLGLQGFTSHFDA
jgi:hypothetical protein